MDYSTFVIEKGDIKIMLSAPHSVNHFRNGKVKSREINTDTLLKMIKERLDINIIYKTNSENEDANYDEVSKYRDTLVEYIRDENIKLLLDIHGMRCSRKEDICIGTAHGKNTKGREDIVEEMVRVFNKYGYKNVSIDEPFSAKNPNCVSTNISYRCDIPAFQIEINNKYRYPESEEYNLESLTEAFVSIIKSISI